MRHEYDSYKTYKRISLNEYKRYTKYLPHQWHSILFEYLDTNNIWLYKPILNSKENVIKLKTDIDNVDSNNILALIVSSVIIMTLTIVYLLIKEITLVYIGSLMGLLIAKLMTLSYSRNRIFLEATEMVVEDLVKQSKQTL